MKQILDRPIIWGKEMFSLRMLKQHRDTLFVEADEMATQGGGIIFVPYKTIQETMVRLLLSALMGHLRQKSKTVWLYRGGLEAAFTPPSADYLVIHDLPSCSGLLEFLEGNFKFGCVVIATGQEDLLAQMDSFIHHRFYGALAAEQKEEKSIAAIQEEELKRFDDVKDIDPYLLISIFDAWGVPLPFNLFARAMQKDEDTFAEWVEDEMSHERLFWLELSGPSALMVATKAPIVAQALVAKMRDNVASNTLLFDEYLSVIKAVDVAEKEERYTILKLFQAILRAGVIWPTLQKSWHIDQTHISWLKELFERCEPEIERIWKSSHTQEIEYLFWGKVFEELRLFEKSKRVFQFGLKQKEKNIYLRQAYARMLGGWAKLEDTYLQDNTANDAYNHAVKLCNTNPYIWQAWGKMEADRRHFREARNRFKQALDAANHPTEKVYALVALADLGVETGSYEEATLRLNEAQALAPFNPYIPLVKGKLFLCQGKFDQTVHCFNEVIEMDAANIAARNALGDMALKRGHFKKATTYFNQVFQIHPENIPTLHALAECYVEEGQFVLETGHHDQANFNFGAAEKRLKHLLEIEPNNAKALVAYGVLLRKWATCVSEQGKTTEAENKCQMAESEFKRVLSKNEKNCFALYARGELFMQQGKFEIAETDFRQILKQDSKNRPAILSLATLKQKQGQREESQRLLEMIERILTKSENIPCLDWIYTANRRAEIESDLENHQKAITILEKSLAKDPENAYTCRTYAKILEQSGESEKALVYRQKVVDLSTNLDV